MHKLIVVGIVLVLLLVTSCATIQRGSLMKNDVSDDYVASTFGKITTQGVGFTIKEQFNDLVRQFKEGTIKDPKLNDDEKEKQLALANGFTYVPEGFLVFWLTIKEPKIVKMREFSFQMEDKEGKSMLTDTLCVSQKWVYSQAYEEDYVTYPFFWIMKLTKPFTKENFTTGDYPVTVTFPNGQKAMYKMAL